MKKQLLLLLVVLIHNTLSFSQVDRYQVPATVGTDITLNAPPPRDTERKTLHNVFWSVISGNSCAVVLNAASDPTKVRIIAEGTAVVKCEVNYYDPYYWKINHPIYGSDVRQYGYYTITCQGGSNPGPNDDPDDDPDDDTYSQEKTAEGYLMWFCFTTINYEKVAVVEVPPFMSSSTACIDRNVTGEVTIPSVAHRLPVRRIASGAFINISGLTNVIIPSSVKYIAENAFYGCSSLESITCENPEPPTGLALNHICSNDSKVTLYVPSGSVSKYKSADGWKNFKEIKEIGSQGEVEPKLVLSASPSSGQVTAGTKVTLTAKADGSTVSDCDIYYTLNGSTPTKSSTKYTSSGITISSACTLKAIAYKDGYETSDILTTSFTIAQTEEINIDATNFPDANFRNWILSQSYGADGKLTASEISSITFIYASENAISSLKGIEHFTSLEILVCCDNQLTSLDLSKNTALTTLYCWNNQLTFLDVSKNTALTELGCQANQLTSLDMSKNTALTTLDCYENLLTSLDVSKNTALTELYCYSNQLTSLDVSKNTVLKSLWCSDNRLTSLDVSKNTALTILSCWNNQLTSLDVSKNTALTELYCESNRLTSLDVSKNTALTELDCFRNQIRGVAMNALISSLPQNQTGDSHKIYVIDNRENDEGNVCTIAQVAAAKAKGWRPRYYNGTTWADYEGSDETADEIVLTIPASGYATFFSSESAYKLPNGLSAKVVKEASHGKLTYETIIIIDGNDANIVPKGVPVMIESNSKQALSYTLTATPSSATYSGTNLLRGSDEATTTTGNGLHYKLSYGPDDTKWDNVFGWYWGAQNGAPFQIDGHKAWLVVPPNNGTRAAGFSVDGEPLDIDSSDGFMNSPREDYYDLQGRRVSHPAKKGIYIRNGKKTVVR